ncbi:MAG: 4-alpha-glucanotransferase [Thermodesulfobacteriota bacterium]|nr:4-alpha-glucanotransferase [Thermodesulfobacteriota bacterium]
MRKAGVLLHPTSLPQGVLDHHVDRFLDWMTAAGLCVWQMLPLGPPHRDHSPYQSYSSHALNPALLPADVVYCREDEAAYCRFESQMTCWLEDYAMFVAVREQFDDCSWAQWPQPLRHRDPVALESFCVEHSARLLELKREQFLLHRLWQQLRNKAHRRGIMLLGDIPIGVAYDSADVWACPQLFKLDDQFRPLVVMGVPPDYFSKQGQRWGNPHYNWSLMQQYHFTWWRARIASALRQFDMVRIDHFRGLQALWEIPAAAATAVEGQWVETPGRQLLEALCEDFPHMPFIAEDLGVITDEVLALRDLFELPGLSVLQFGFDGSRGNPHSVDNQVENTVVYTGTHDNDTTCGWFESLDPEVQENVLQQLPCDAGSMPWPLIAAALQSPAQLAMIPMQDWLALDGQHRFNTPGTTEKNWSWRFSWDQVPEQLSATIRDALGRSRRYRCGGET